MSIISLPDNNFRSVQWTLVQPTQVNRSEFTSARQVMQLPGASYWKASADHVPIKGESSVRAWRSFLAQLGGQASTFRLIAVEAAQTSVYFPMTGGGAAFVNRAGTSVSGRTITKTASTSAWSAAADTNTTTSSGGARIVFRAGQTNADLMMGLTDNAAIDAGYTSLLAALNPQSNGRLRVWESGNDRGDFGPYTTDDILAVVYDDAADTFSYYRSGERLRRVSATSGLALYGDSSFSTPGGQALDVYFSSASSAYGVGAGNTTLPLANNTPGSTVLSEGMLATALLEGGGAQLLVVTADAVADGSGNATLNFKPMLRGVPYALATRYPFALVALDSPEAGWNVDPGTLYGFSFAATEAY